MCAFMHGLHAIVRGTDGSREMVVVLRMLRSHTHTHTHTQVKQKTVLSCIHNVSASVYVSLMDDHLCTFTPLYLSLSLSLSLSLVRFVSYSLIHIHTILPALSAPSSQALSACFIHTLGYVQNVAFIMADVDLWLVLLHPTK